MRFIHSNKKYIERTMYPINPYINTPVASLPMEAFIAPIGFNPDTQELNIVKAFSAYPDENKKYIFSVGTSATTILIAVTGRSYVYSENGGAYISTTGGSVTWTIGSTKRHIIAIDANITITANLVSSAIWAYLGEKVTSIGQMNGVTTVKYIHMTNLNSLTSFVSNNFDGCTGLTGTLNIPNSITALPGVGFRYCVNLTGQLVIPNSVTFVPVYAFSGCTGLTGLTLPNSATSIDANAFSGCTGLTGTLTLPNTVKSIGSNTFKGTKFSGSLVFPSTMESIGGGAFTNCSQLTGNILIPNTVKSIGSNTFSGCTGLTGSLTIGTGIAANGLGEALLFGSKFTSLFGGNDNYSIIDNIIYSKTSGVESKCLGTINNLVTPNSVMYLVASITSIGANAFSQCANYTGTLSLPNSVTSIGSYCFDGCTGLTGTLTLPNSITSIGSYCFDGCTGLTGILTLPNAITVIPIVAFRATGFTELALPSNVTTVSVYAFDNCMYLAKISISATNPPTGLNVNTFSGVNKTTCILHVPSGSLSLYQTAPQWSSFVNIVDDL